MSFEDRFGHTKKIQISHSIFSFKSSNLVDSTRKNNFFLSFHIDISTKNSHTHFFQASKFCCNFLDNSFPSFQPNQN